MLVLFLGLILTSLKVTKEKTSEEKIPVSTQKEKVAHREGMNRISNKDIDKECEGNINISSVRNDTTGNWRIVTIAENINIEECALSYYEKYFGNNDEIHAIVNFVRKTTTKISVLGNMLDVTTYEYVENEEHDAKALFSGMVYKEYHVYLDNGDIEELSLY